MNFRKNLLKISSIFASLLFFTPVFAGKGKKGPKDKRRVNVKKSRRVHIKKSLNFPKIKAEKEKNDINFASFKQSIIECINNLQKDCGSDEHQRQELELFKNEINKIENNNKDKLQSSLKKMKESYQGCTYKAVTKFWTAQIADLYCSMVEQGWYYADGEALILSLENSQLLIDENMKKMLFDSIKKSYGLH